MAVIVKRPAGMPRNPVMEALRQLELQEARAAKKKKPAPEAAAPAKAKKRKGAK